MVSKVIKPVEILLVEDNPADVRMTIESIKDGRLANRLNVVWDGLEAMDFLLRRGKHASALRPDIVLLDLKLPKLSGHEVLEKIRSDPLLRDLQVVVLTTSDAEADMAKSFDKNINSYIVKPLDVEKLLNAVRSVENLWLNIVKIEEHPE